MPSYMTTLGFPVTTEQDVRHYIFLATEFGRKIETFHGSYTLWEPGEGLQLWVQTNLHKRILGMRLHFSGQARMRVGIISTITRQGQNILDGTLYALADPAHEDPMQGKYPFVFDVPDYDTYQNLYLPTLGEVQLVAFASSMKCFATDKAYQDTYPALAPESVIAPTLPKPGSRRREPLQSEVHMYGRILETRQLTNPVTGLKFYWAHVRTDGGEMDVVADPQIVEGALVNHGILGGLFWLSGRLHHISQV